MHHLSQSTYGLAGIDTGLAMSLQEACWFKGDAYQGLEKAGINIPP
jgi:hypothetical protein